MVDRRCLKFAIAVTMVAGYAPIAIVQGQDSPGLARALERADRFDAAMGPKPQPTAKWLGGDRLAYSPTGRAPWAILEGSTARRFMATHPVPQ